MKILFVLLFSQVRSDVRSDFQSGVRSISWSVVSIRELIGCSIIYLRSVVSIRELVRRSISWSVVSYTSSYTSVKYLILGCQIVSILELLKV